MPCLTSPCYPRRYRLIRSSNRPGQLASSVVSFVQSDAVNPDSGVHSAFRNWRISIRLFLARSSTPVQASPLSHSQAEELHVFTKIPPGAIRCKADLLSEPLAICVGPLTHAAASGSDAWYTLASIHKASSSTKLNPRLSAPDFSRLDIPKPYSTCRRHVAPGLRSRCASWP